MFPLDSRRDTSGTFDGWRDRLTFIVAEAGWLVLAVMVMLGAFLVWWSPEVPDYLPGYTVGVIAAVFLFGPPLLAIFYLGLKRLRNRRMVTVYHINGVTDEREKYQVAPGVWDEKTVDGPSPYRVNDESAFEVREFDWYEDTEELVVRGCEFSQLADSKLVTVKTMLEDVHGDLVDAFLERNRLRARVKKMGLEIQEDVINAEAEADERGLMNPKTSVREAWENAQEDAEKEVEQIQDVDAYADAYAEAHDVRPLPERPQTDRVIERAAEPSANGDSHDS
jgi:hypothetical protein